MKSGPKLMKPGPSTSTFNQDDDPALYQRTTPRGKERKRVFLSHLFGGRSLTWPLSGVGCGAWCYRRVYNEAGPYVPALPVARCAVFFACALAPAESERDASNRINIRRGRGVLLRP